MNASGPSSSMKIFLGLWVVVLLAGFVQLGRYSQTAGAKAHAPSRWPAQSQLKFRGRLPQLVTFLHPQCSCSQATVYELARLAMKIGSRAEIHIVFESNPLRPEGEQGSDLWKSVQRQIPSAKLYDDPKNLEAPVFGAKTSGQTYLYSEQGGLLFEGGITASRGHAGAAIGQMAILTAIEKAKAQVPSSVSVFGCSFETKPISLWKEFGWISRN